MKNSQSKIQKEIDFMIGDEFDIDKDQPKNERKS